MAKAWSPIEWERYKAQKAMEVMDDWENADGTCLVCELPMKLHPPGRAISSNPVYCWEAKQAAAR